MRSGPRLQTLSRQKHGFSIHGLRLTTRRTVEMITGMRTMGYFAERPFAAIFSPTVNSNPLLLSFQGSGTFCHRRCHSTSTREKFMRGISSVENSGMVMSNSSMRRARCVWKSEKSGGWIRRKPTKIPTSSHARSAHDKLLEGWCLQASPKGNRKRRVA